MAELERSDAERQINILHEEYRSLRDEAQQRGLIYQLLAATEKLGASSCGGGGAAVGGRGARPLGRSAGGSSRARRDSRRWGVTPRRTNRCGARRRVLARRCRSW